MTSIRRQPQQFPISCCLGFAILLLVARSAIAADTGFSGNTCEPHQPWPCKTNNVCLSLDFVCDGEKDCDDGYDEDPELCIAKKRPPVKYLANYIEKYYSWLVPRFLGEGRPNELAHELIQARNLKEFSRHQQLTRQQRGDLLKLLQGAASNKYISLILLDMPPNAWYTFQATFGRIAKSGFLPTASYPGNGNNGNDGNSDASYLDDEESETEPV